MSERIIHEKAERQQKTAAGAVYDMDIQGIRNAFRSEHIVRLVDAKLFEAAKNCDTNLMVKLIHEDKADTNSLQRSRRDNSMVPMVVALIESSDNHHISNSVFATLIENSMKPVGAEYGDLITKLINNGFKLETVKLFNENGYGSVQPDTDKFTRLMAASYHGRFEIVKYLVELDHDSINKKDDDGLSAIYHAAERPNDSKPIVVYLYSKGAELYHKQIPGDSRAAYIYKSKKTEHYDWDKLEELGHEIDDILDSVRSRDQYSYDCVPEDVLGGFFEFEALNMQLRQQ